MNDQESSSMRTNVNGVVNLPNHQLAMTVLMTPDMANFTGNVHGGAILKLWIKWRLLVPAAMPGGM
jgi:acyl-CoA hydrolase